MDGGNQQDNGTMYLQNIRPYFSQTTRIDQSDCDRETGFLRVSYRCVSRIRVSELYAHHRTRAQQKRLAPYSVIVHHVDC